MVSKTANNSFYIFHTDFTLFYGLCGVYSYITYTTFPFFQEFDKGKKLVFTNFDIILISLALIALWYFTVAKVQFASGAQVLGKTVEIASGGGITSALVSTRGAYVLGILGWYLNPCRIW